MSGTVDWDFVLESLRWTRRAFEDYRYPTEDIRQHRLAEVDAAITAIRQLKRRGN